MAGGELAPLPLPLAAASQARICSFDDHTYNRSLLMAALNSGYYRTVAHKAHKQAQLLTESVDGTFKHTPNLVSLATQ
jgi:hypothetical protein